MVVCHHLFRSWLRVLVETRPRRYCFPTWLNSIAVAMLNQITSSIDDSLV